jgi:hypothetical protein
MVEPIDIAPSTVEHCEARAVASAWELMVAVGWEQMADCAALGVTCQSITHGREVWYLGE